MRRGITKRTGGALLRRWGCRAGLRAAALAVVGLGPAATTRAAKYTEDRNLWAIVALTGPLLRDGPGAGRWRYTFDAPQRFGDDARRLSQSVWRAGLGYRLNAPWSVWAGYSHTRTDTPLTGTPYGEHRAFQQLLWVGRAGGFDLGFRQRLEERFPETGRDMGLRLRHQFRLGRPFRAVPALSWILSEEFFLNLNPTDFGARRGLDQNRAFAGLGWAWSPVARNECGYLHHFTNRSRGPNRLNHVAVVSLTLAFE